MKTAMAETTMLTINYLQQSIKFNVLTSETRKNSDWTVGSRQSFATPHSRVPSAMIGQYTLKPDTHSNRDTGNAD